MAHVDLQNMTIRLGGKEIIKNLDLRVEAGEFLVLLGPSGCGKSTLLHSIAGLVDMHAGRIAIGGQDVSEAEPSERGIGMVFQSYALYPTMTVEANMSFGLRVAGTPRAEIKRRVTRAAAMLQLDALLERKPAQLSGGQRQRVAIGRALVREARVLLFDEPLSNLDAKLRTELRRELKLLHGALGATMIYVTHDQVEAMTLASRIAVMHAGRILQVGTPAEIYERPATIFVGEFLGSPPMNFMHGAVDGAGCFSADGVRLALGAGTVEGGVELGVRPEHVRLGAGELRGEVVLVEPMGNHQVVWLRCGRHRIASLVHDGRQWTTGEQVDFAIDAARVSLFDPTGGQRL